MREGFILKTIPLRKGSRNECLKLLTLYHKVEAINAFALVQVKRDVLDIFLLCAVPSDRQYGSMMAYAVHNFAVRKKCTKLYTSPRTPELRYTFMKYGFEHLRGIVDIDEVLVKHIRVSSFIQTGKTLKLKKYGFTKKSKLRVNNEEVLE